ncbi:biotin transporter BioY [Lactiplantibacillus modestisalitolerans]|uniref:Biotin transporter n=1 Tax=Lactiplantibacillus modestisalitolerans TaxID=1457219 RepID=A0ABV5WV74_9LACO
MTARNVLKPLVRAAMVTALIIILGLFPGIPVGIIPVPIVLQNMGIILAGELLGRRYGTLAVGVFLALAAVGLPVLSGGRGGAAVFVGPTGGYLFGWLLVPLLLGSLLYHLPVQPTRHWWWELLIVWSVGIFFVDLVGAGWLAIQAHLAFSTALISNVAFLPGDLLKATFAVFLSRRIRKIVHLEAGGANQ